MNQPQSNHTNSENPTPDQWLGILAKAEQPDWDDFRANVMTLAAELREGMIGRKDALNGIHNVITAWERLYRVSLLEVCEKVHGFRICDQEKLLATAISHIDVAEPWQEAEK